MINIRRSCLVVKYGRVDLTFVGLRGTARAPEDAAVASALLEDDREKRIDSAWAL
jgi:hypothetical protein